jgi:hypothetical protein
MFGFSYDVESVVAALYHASNSVQVAANMLIEGGVRPLPGAGPLLHAPLTDTRYPEAPAVAQLRGILLQPEGFVTIARSLRAISPQVAAQIETNAVPFLTALGMAAYRSSAGHYSVIPSQAPLPERQPPNPEVDRLIRLGYAADDVRQALLSHPEQAERILRGEE